MKGLESGVALAALAWAALSTSLAAQQPPPLADLEPIGVGTSGSNGVPRLVALGRPAVGEPGMGVRLEGGLPGAPALLIVGSGVDPTPLPQFGARLLPALPALRVSLGTLDAQGDSALLTSGPDAASPALMGLEFALQGLVADPTAQGGAAFTAGLRLRFGVGFAAAGLFDDLGYAAALPPDGADRPFATGDFDGDGRRDMLMLVGLDPKRVAVFRQLVDGSFAPPVESSAPGGITRGWRVADVDGDSRLDLVLERPGALVHVLPGLGDGRFGPPIALQGPGSSPCRIDVADVDGDGALDLLVANWDTDQLGVLSGLASPAHVFPIGGKALALRVGDVTGDGLLDAVAPVFSSKSYELAVLPGLGGGQFAPPELSSLNFFSADRLELGDLDGDGDLDAIVGNASTWGLVVLENDGAAGFTLGAPLVEPGLPPAQQLGLADLEPDGDLDVVVAYGSIWSPQMAVILPNLSGGVLGLPQTVASLQSVDVADMDGDGRMDLTGSRVSVAAAYCYRGLGGGDFELTHADPDLALFPARAADFDGDGDLDLAGQILHDGRWELAVALWSSPQGFGAPATIDAQGYVAARDGLSVADVDGDGRPDVVVAGNQTVRIFRGDGAGNLLPPIVESLVGAYAPRVADMNGDGRADLVVSRTSLGLSVLLALPGGGYAPPLTVSPPPWPDSFDRFDIGDIDADGDVDVVVQAQDGFHVLSGVGDGTLVDEVVADPGSGPAKQLPLLLVDVDGDADPDLVRLDFHPSLAVWLNDGAGSFSPKPQLAMLSIGQTLRAADLNLDGALDLICDDVRLGFGDGTFADGLPGVSADALGDFDGDGDVDLFANGFLYENRAR